MNNKGEMGIGILITVAIAIIVGTILLTGAANNVAQVQNTKTIVNQTVTLAAVGTGVEIPGYQWYQGTFVLALNTTAGQVDAANYTVYKDVSTGGAKLYIKANEAPNAGKSYFASFTAEPIGYDESTGGRAVAGIIILLAAMALMVVAIYPSIKDGVLG